MDQKEISDTLAEANTYLNRLRNLDNELGNAEKQINGTFQETEKAINQTFTNLKSVLINILNKRQEHLLNRARKVQNESIGPLEECRNVITDKIDSTIKLLNLGESLLKGGINDLNEFRNKSSLLGTLPEVPELKEVPFISFQFESSFLQNELKDICSNFGDISRIAPIQISQLLEKPGAILVEWESVDNEERMTDIQCFRIQRAFGDVLNDKHLIVNFNDCYEGLESQFLARDLQVNQKYSFRVCCKFEGSSEWSPWSLPQVAHTTLKHFSWQQNDDFCLSNENKIAKPIKSSLILYSNGPQFQVGHSVEFTFLEIDTSNAIIGLVTQENYSRTNYLQSINDGSFLIDKNGKIYVDGTEKSTILSQFSRGLKVTFICELVNKNTVRVNIDANDRRVTYQWAIPPDSEMYFACQFFSTNWKIMVE